jgi:hypothetical protein
MSAQDDANRVSRIFGLPAEVGKDANGNDSIVLRVGSREEATALWKRAVEIKKKLDIPPYDMSFNANTREAGEGTLVISLEDPGAAEKHTAAEKNAVLQQLEKGSDQLKTPVKEATGKLPSQSEKEVERLSTVFGLPAEVGKDANGNETIVLKVGSKEQAAALWYKTLNIIKTLDISDYDLRVNANTPEAGVGSLVFSLEDPGAIEKRTAAEKNVTLHKLEKGADLLYMAVREIKGGKASNMGFGGAETSKMENILEALAQFKQEPHLLEGYNVSANSTQVKPETQLRGRNT